MEHLSQKNARVLIHEGFRYRKDRQHAHSTTWRCTKAGCKGRLIEYNDLRKPTTEHNHAPDPGLIGTWEFKTAVKALAKTSERRPRQIIQSVASTSAVTPEVAVNLPSYDSLRKTIHKVRTAARGTSFNFEAAEDIVIPEEFANLPSGEKFLISDTTEHGSRILMFGTHKNVSVLNEYQHWCVDGTFSVAPKTFSQIYTIHALLQDEAIPLIYVFLTNKQEESYIRLFGILSQIEPNLSPASIICDFELAAINAIKRVFPRTEIVCCFFHLSQNLWKKIQQSRLTDQYAKNEDTRRKCKMLLALSLVPVRAVQFAFEIIQETYPEDLQPVLDSWESNYVGNRINDVQPRFALKLWNMFDRVKAGLPTTNNSLEAWHGSFQRMLDCHHPAVIELISQLQKEQSYTDIRISRFKSGVRKKESPHSKYVIRKHKIKAMVDSYTFSAVTEYLEAMSYNFTL